MLLEALVSARERPIPFRIFATDVSEDALALGREGVYNYTAVQKTPLRHVKKYFAVKNESYAIAPTLKNRVHFSCYDLLDERSGSPAASIYGDFDLVLCSNVLFYYRPTARRRILDKACLALRPGGFFVTGEAEAAIAGAHATLRAVAPPVAVFQKREGAAPL
jgi:chemotaxis methyl-accepting protein methylase